jgi:hypothetical protein
MAQGLIASAWVDENRRPPIPTPTRTLLVRLAAFCRFFTSFYNMMADHETWVEQMCSEYCESNFLLGLMTGAMSLEQGTEDNK